MHHVALKWWKWETNLNSLWLIQMFSSLILCENGSISDNVGCLAVQQVSLLLWLCYFPKSESRSRHRALVEISFEHSASQHVLKKRSNTLYFLGFSHMFTINMAFNLRVSGKWLKLLKFCTYVFDLHYLRIFVLFYLHFPLRSNLHFFLLHYYLASESDKLLYIAYILMHQL